MYHIAITLTKGMKELHLPLLALLLVPLVYGQEPTNRPSNGK